MRVKELRKELEQYDDDVEIVVIDSTTQRGYSSFHLTPDEDWRYPDDDNNDEVIVHKLIVYI